MKQNNFISKIMTFRFKLISFCLIIIVITFFVVEHPFVQPIERFASLIGLVDSEHNIIGITDIRSIDHSLGSEDAEIILIEYSDFGCTLCAYMQDIFRRLVEERNVRVISRHLYQSFSGKYYERALAAECVGKYSGDDSYFSYTKWLYDNQLNIEKEDLLTQAISEGVSTENFSRCIEKDKKIIEKVQNDSDEGWKLGARGTPYIIVIYKDKPVGISYANQYKAFLDRISDLIIKSESN